MQMQRGRGGGEAVAADQPPGKHVDHTDALGFHLRSTNFLRVSSLAPDDVLVKNLLQAASLVRQLLPSASLVSPLTRWIPGFPTSFPGFTGRNPEI